MLRPEMQVPAAEALCFILATARQRAVESGHDELSDLLDKAEYLPALMAEAEDQTERFAMAVRDLADRHGCGHAAVLFDQGGRAAPAPVPSCPTG